MISETGIVLLLFLVGLEMNPGKTARYGKRALIPGIGQFLLCRLQSEFPFYFYRNGPGVSAGSVPVSSMRSFKYRYCTQVTL